MSVGLTAGIEEFGCGGVEELLGGVAGEHRFEHAAVVGVGQAGQGAGEPPVELGSAGVRLRQVGVDLAGGFVVFGAERAVVLPVPLAG